MADKIKLTIEFDNQEALKHFTLWLCESGEQAYWDWMEYREQEEEGDITAVDFHYHGEKDEVQDHSDTDLDEDEDDYKKFMCDNTIRTTVGRLNRS